MVAYRRKVRTEPGLQTLWHTSTLANGTRVRGGRDIDAQLEDQRFGFAVRLNRGVRPVGARISCGLVFMAGVSARQSLGARLMVRRTTRSLDWGFPRWREYGSETAATTVRTCDRHGCDAVGDKPAPKSPNSPDRWYFCETHAGEYNRNWDYFEGLSPEEAAAREAKERTEGGGWRESSHHQWAGPGDGTRSRDEMRALGVLGVASDSSFEDIRIAWRGLAKANHPDLKPDDPEAVQRFREIQAAWDVLRAAEERRVVE